MRLGGAVELSVRMETIEPVPIRRSMLARVSPRFTPAIEWSSTIVRVIVTATAAGVPANARTAPATTSARAAFALLIGTWCQDCALVVSTTFEGSDPRAASRFLYLVLRLPRVRALRRPWLLIVFVGA